MSAQDYPILEIDATFPDPIGSVTGVFEFPKATVEEGTRTGPLTESAFDDLLGALSQLLDDGEAIRKGISADAGGGQHFFEITYDSKSGDDGQWGYTADTNTLDEATASGGDRIQKANVFNNYIRHSAPDSFTPARLEYGIYSPNGIATEDHVKVFLEDPNAVIDTDASTAFDGSLTLIETVDLSGVVTEQNRTG